MKRGAPAADEVGVGDRNFHDRRAIDDGAAVLQERGSGLADSRRMMTEIELKDDAAAVAPRAGGDLRAARERLGWELPEAAAHLRIRLPHLYALEAGRLSELPANAYAVGFLRTYASALGLDPEEMVRRFRAEATEVTRKTELDFPAPVPERGLPAGAIMLVGLVLLAGVYAGWYRLSGEGRLPPETVAPVPERLAPLAQQAVPPTVAPVIAPATAVQTAVAPPPTLSVPSEPTPTVPLVSPSSAAAAPVNPLPAMPQAAALDPDQPRIIIRASADAWIQVKDRSGTVLLNRILKPGESWPVPPKPGLTFTTGNAGGTELVVDGTSGGALGGAGAVRRDLALDPDAIKEGRLAQGSTTGTPPSRTQQ